MKLIPLGKSGLFVKVDNEDYDYLNQFSWYIVNSHKFKYPIRKKQIDLKRKIISMHREIMKANCSKIIVDHIDHDLLNCQKSNLRICTKQQNRMNCTASKNGTSKYLGVYFHKQSGKWRSEIRINLKATYLGSHNSQESAARAYDKKAKELFGEFANLNFKY